MGTAHSVHRGALLKALQQDLDRNLSPEAAGVRFCGGQAAVLPEFVAAVATATEAEVFAVVLTALDTTVHIGQQPVELRRLRGCLQGEVAQVAQIERSVPVAGNGQQFWIKRGEISLPIDAQDRKGAVQFVLGHALFPWIRLITC